MQQELMRAQAGTLFSCTPKKHGGMDELSGIARTCVQGVQEVRTLLAARHAHPARTHGLHPVYAPPTNSTPEPEVDSVQWTQLLQRALDAVQPSVALLEGRTIAVVGEDVAAALFDGSGSNSTPAGGVHLLFNPWAGVRFVLPRGCLLGAWNDACV
ncbi:hypothetical protein EON66_05460 [archaeon]|nr:MAG: hypothetical protein EON66_05460 [archaeon]